MHFVQSLFCFYFIYHTQNCYYLAWYLFMYLFGAVSCLSALSILLGNDADTILV